MKKIITLILILVFTFNNLFAVGTVYTQNTSSVNNFTNVSDPSLLVYLENSIYYDLVSELNSEDFFVEDIKSIYISKEYLDEVRYNSKANIYFGYCLEDLYKQFQGTKYFFTFNQDTRQTTVKEFIEYDSTYDDALRNIAIGSGVILICISVSFATGGVAPAVSVIFATSAKSAAEMALCSGLISGVSAGLVTGFETGDFNQVLKSAAKNGSESFKWGAILGSLYGGATETIGLKSATTKGLTMNEVALIQKESKYPLDVIGQFSSMEQYIICKNAGLKSIMVDGKLALIRDIDLQYVDEFGRTNLERMRQGLSALDPSTGKSYQLHHIGQKVDSTLAILTEAEHMQGGNNLIWHDVSKASEIDRIMFREQRESFWKAMAEYFIKQRVER